MLEFFSFIFSFQNNELADQHLFMLTNCLLASLSLFLSPSFSPPSLFSLSPSPSLSLSLIRSLLHTGWGKSRFMVVSMWNSLFLYYYLLSIALLSIRTTVNLLLPHLHFLSLFLPFFPSFSLCYYHHELVIFKYMWQVLIYRTYYPYGCLNIPSLCRSLFGSWALLTKPGGFWSLPCYVIQVATSSPCTFPAPNSE